MRILIAEDDAVSRAILRLAIERLGHEHTQAEDGQDAWELLSEQSFDVVISDWKMPKVDGLELCRRLRARSHPAYTYFILLTSIADRKQVIGGLRDGADDYLTKPLDTDELHARLIAAGRVMTLHRRLYEEARRDPLTKVCNRLQFSEDMAVMQADLVRYGRRFVVGLADIDRFKAYNDTYGHLAGDDALRAVSSELLRLTRTSDRVYRFGGEEFAIVLPEQSLSTGRIALSRIRQGIERLAVPHVNNPPWGCLTISAGLAEQRPDQIKSLDQLLREADAALYGAKAWGRNRVSAHGEPLPPRPDGTATAAAPEQRIGPSTGS